MAASRLRELCFGNWRNKGVALFFALIIWFVAFRAETQEGKVPVSLVIVPRPENQVVIRQEVVEQGNFLPFDRTVELTVTGPRKQIEKLREDSRLREVRFPVDSGVDPGSTRKRIPLAAGAFGFIPPGVAITRIAPEALFLTFDAAEDREFPVEPVFQSVPEGMETEPAKIEPPAVNLHGPRSLLSQMRVVVECRVGMAERYEETLPLTLRYADAVDRDLVRSTVVFKGEARARVSVRLRFKSDTLDAEGIRVRFLVPAARFPFRVQFEEETIAVRFQGPLEEIRRLRERVKAPDFVLAVQVPPVAGEGEQTIPFTEDALLLYGFSERLQLLQHPARQAKGKGAWTYSLIPIDRPPTTASK